MFAFYEYANKIVAIPRTFITVISTVLFPRACLIISKNGREEMNKNCSIFAAELIFYWVCINF